MSVSLNDRVASVFQVKERGDAILHQSTEAALALYPIAPMMASLQPL